MLRSELTSTPAMSRGTVAQIRRIPAMITPMALQQSMCGLAEWSDFVSFVADQACTRSLESIVTGGWGVGCKA